MDQSKNKEQLYSTVSFSEAALKRRSFLKYAGASMALTAAVAAGCNDDDNDFPDMDDDVYLGKGDMAIDIRDHETAHREFFKAALQANAITNLEVDFSSINFSSRERVLATAKAFEDLGVAAYNGAGQLIVKPEYLLLVGKIVSNPSKSITRKEPTGFFSNLYHFKFIAYSFYGRYIIVTNFFSQLPNMHINSPIGHNNRIFPNTF